MLEKFRRLLGKKLSYGSISWKITENCNSRCSTCIHWKNKKENELSLDEIKTIINDAKKIGIKAIRLTGGEPLLRNDLQLIVDHIKKNNMRVSINTNGLLSMNIKGVDNWYIALDGMGELYKKIRGVDGFHSVMRNISKLKYDSPFVNIVISTILMKSTLSSIETIVNFARAIDAKFTFNLIDVSPYFFSGESTDFNLNETFEKNEWDNVINYLSVIFDEKVFMQDWKVIERIPMFYDEYESLLLCPTVKENIKLGSSGEFYLCWSYPPVDNLRDNSLINIIKKESIKKTTDELFNHNCCGCTCGWGRRVRYYLNEKNISG